MKRTITITLFSVAVLSFATYHRSTLRREVAKNAPRLTVLDPNLNPVKSVQLLPQANQVIPIASASDNWRSLPPLTPSEMSRFKSITPAIARLNHWGRMADGEIVDVRQVMWNLGDRGLAQFGRNLAEVKAGSQLSKDQAKDLIDELDMLAYAAGSGWIIATNILTEISDREISLGLNGDITDKASAYVTLEALELAAKSNPQNVRDQVALKDPRLMPAYAYHFIIGRRMAGKDTASAIAEAKSNFGDDAVNSALAAK